MKLNTSLLSLNYALLLYVNFISPQWAAEMQITEKKQIQVQIVKTNMQMQLNCAKWKSIIKQHKETYI